MNNKINLNEDVVKIITKLEKAGYSAYLVGGCVRDSLLGVEPKDFDLTTNARPEQVTEVFKNENIIDKNGLAFGTVIVVMNGEEYEITTFRKDGVYSDGRRPDKIEYSDTIEEDLSRRDFTINAMAYNPSTGLVDPFNGAQDLENKVLRCVGDVAKRFEEDNLRLYRCIRFAVKYNLTIEDATYKAMMAGFESGVTRVSGNRIRVELNQILKHMNRENIEYAKIAILNAIPELKETVGFNQHNPYHCYDVFGHIIEATLSVENNYLLRLAVLMHDVAKPERFTIGDDGIGHFYGHAEKSSFKVIEIMDRLKYTNKERDYVANLVKWHDYRVSASKKAVKRAMLKIGADIFEDFIKIQRADANGKSPERREGQLIELAELESVYKEVINNDEFISRRDLAVNGRDIMELLKIGPSEAVRVMLEKCLDYVIEDHQRNNKDELYKFIIGNCRLSS